MSNIDEYKLILFNKSSDYVANFDNKLKEYRNATDKNIIFPCLNDGFGEISFGNFLLSI